MMKSRRWGDSSGVGPESRTTLRQQICLVRGVTEGNRGITKPKIQPDGLKGQAKTTGVSGFPLVGPSPGKKLLQGDPSRKKKRKKKNLLRVLNTAERQIRDRPCSIP